MIPVDPNYVMCDATEEGAAMGLLGVMSGLSEEMWCAGWLSGLEHSMWAIRQGGSRKFGMGEVSQRQADLLRLLSEECSGWWVWDDAKGPVFVRMSEWEKRLAALPAQPPGAET